MFACTHHPQSAQLGNSELAEIFAEARNEDLANVAGNSLMVSDFSLGNSWEFKQQNWE